MVLRARHGAALSFAALVLSTVVLVLPSMGDPQRSIGPGAAGDPLLNVYLLEWGKAQLEQGLPDPWNPPFFYPARRVLTLSDHLLGPAAAFLVLRRAGLSSLGAYNALVLATFALGGAIAFGVLRQSGLRWRGAFVGAWVFAFTGYRWHAIGHYQVLRMQWIPLVLLSFDRLLERPTVLRGALFVVAYALHVSGGAYLAVLVHGSLAVLLANRLLASPGMLLDTARWRVWLPAGLAALCTAAAFYLPYLDSGLRLERRHPLDEVRAHGAVLASYLTPSPMSLDARLLPFLPADRERGTLFPGAACALLVVSGLLPMLRSARRAREGSAWPDRARVAVGAALVGLGLALGDRVTLRDGAASAPGWLGGYGVPLLCALAGLAVLAWGMRHTRLAGATARGGVWGRGLIASGAAALLLCLPTFFVAAWSALPGMRAMRVPPRAFALALFPIAFLAAIGWDRLAAACRRRSRGWPLAAVVLLALLVETLPRIPAWSPAPDAPGFPAYVRWIAAHEEVKAYLELPLGHEPHWETAPMYLQTLHWRPMANGYSAVVPPEFEEIRRLCQPFPDAAGLSRLASLGITHVVVHWRMPEWQPGPRVRARVVRFRQAFDETLRRAGSVAVYSDADTEIVAVASDEKAAAPEHRGLEAAGPGGRRAN